MAFDIIVFNQEELDRAIEAGIKSIALCDNSFSLPDIAGIQYTIIGHVTIDDDELALPAESEDKEEEIPAYAYVENKPLAFSSSHSGSYSSSYNSSYGGSFSGSYRYEYEYEKGSFSSSYSGSFISSYYSFISGFTFEFGSYNGSFWTSYYGSYGGSFGTGYYGSYRGSYGASYGGSRAGVYELLPDIIEYGSSGIIFVNGYGINLI